MFKNNIKQIQTGFRTGLTWNFFDLRAQANVPRTSPWSAIWSSLKRPRPANTAYVLYDSLVLLFRNTSLKFKLSSRFNVIHIKLIGKLFWFTAILFTCTCRHLRLKYSYWIIINTNIGPTKFIKDKQHYNSHEPYWRYSLRVLWYDRSADCYRFAVRAASEEAWMSLCLE